MDVQFFTEGGIQIIQMRGTLRQTEAAAVRITLEKKINVGRTKVVIDLSGFNIQDDTTLKGFSDILSYSLNRAVETACCGILPSQWPLLLNAGAKQPKFYVNRDEALFFLSQEPQPKPAEEPPKEGGGDADEALKKEALEELLGKYKIYQFRDDDDDPMRLGFYIDRYKENPQSVGAHVEARARATLDSINEQIKALDAECHLLAVKVKAAIFARKLPNNDTEVENKLEAVKAELEKKKQENEELSKKNREIGQFLEKLKKDLEAVQKNTEKDVKDMEVKIEQLTKETESLDKELKK